MSVVPHPATSEQLLSLEGRHRWVSLLPEIAQLAHAIANTDFVPKTLRGNEAEITAIILYGDELGMAPMQSLAKIAIVDGRPALAAEAQRALILAAGHLIWPEDHTTTKFTWAGKRRGSQEIARFTWTMDDAKRAGIAGKMNWRTYPRAMLSARASAELARAMFADVIGGLGAIEEFEDVDGSGSATAPVAAGETGGTKRRRPQRTASTPVVATVPPGQPSEPPPPPLDEPTPGASDAQMRRIFAGFAERGMLDRDQQLDWINQRLERTIVHRNELTDIEASTVIEALGADDELSPPDESGYQQATLVEEPELVNEGMVETLAMLRKEAGVNDEWLRMQLRTLGLADVPDERITRATIKRLTTEQGRALADKLNGIIDSRPE